MKLYTKTVCPKCIRVKSEISRLGVDVEVVNMDQDSNARETIIEQGIMAAPVLETTEKFITDVEEIIEALEAAK